MKNTYISDMKKHLASYKKDRLGIDANGIWNTNGKPYTHILPQECQRLNILEPYRAEFWASRHAGTLGVIKLHGCFHHLTSSQAMCFNLFFPFLDDRRENMPMLLQAFGLPTEGVAEAVFEKKLDAREGTVFDFFIGYKDRRHVTFEVKFTETDFGAAKQDAIHDGRFRSIYFAMAEKTLKPAYRDVKAFLNNYQFLRNLVYLGTGSNNDLCLFVLPKTDPAYADIEERLDDALLPELRSKAKVVWLEGLVSDLVALAKLAGSVRLCHHLDAFREKHIPA